MAIYYPILYSVTRQNDIIVLKDKAKPDGTERLSLC